MRILFINDYPPPMGGAENYLLAIARELDRQGHEVGLFTVRTTANEVPFPGPVYHVHTRYTAKNAVFNRTTADHFRSFVREFRPEIIHAHNFFRVLSPSWLQDLPCPAVMTVHDYQLVCPVTILLHRRTAGPCLHTFGSECRSEGCLDEKHYLYERLKRKRHRKLLSKLCWFITPSMFAATTLESAGICQGNCRYLPNALPDRDHANNESVASPPMVMAIGRMLPEKGFRCLIGAAGLLKRQGVGLELNIQLIGTGPYLDELRQLSHKIGVDDVVTFTGYVENIGDYYRQASAVVIPSIWPENCPMVALEAMRAGKPVIASNVGGLPELIQHRKTGLLVPPADPDALAGALRSMIQDPKMLEPFGAAARERFEELYIMDTHINALLGIYRDALEARTERDCR